jgi:hypothetical protein
MGNGEQGRYSLLRNLPFTLPGFTVFIIAAVILVRSLAARNAYEIILSLAALALWVVLWLAGKWAVRRLAAMEPVWTIPSPLGAASATASASDWLVTSETAGVPVFFRLHFYVRGRFFPQAYHEACVVFAETSLSRKSDTARLKLSFPLGGVFRGETSGRLRDIFGFFSFPCGHNRERTFYVRSAPCGAKALRIDAQSGAEDRRNKSSSDEERYYMREYSPGDRFRDINWKSSERIDTLITRISPDNQEKITRFEVYFRNYGPLGSQSKLKLKDGAAIADLWLLDRAKARLAWFLRKVKEENASYIFHVRSAAMSWDLNDNEDIDAFLEELSALPFRPVQNETSHFPQSEGELFVFSTACDIALPAFLQTLQSRPFSLFLSQSLISKKDALKYESLRIRDFFSGGFFPLPAWLLPPRKRQLNISGGRVLIDYAETRL